MASVPTKTVSTTTPSGRKVSAYMALPAQRPAPAVITIHAFEGLTDEFKSFAPYFAEKGFVGLAIDLYDGRVGQSHEESFQIMQTLDAEAATETAVTWVQWLRGHKETTGQVGTVGWCFGGRWSLNTSLATPVDATVIYYGGVDHSDERLQALKGPVLGHFGREDKIVPQDQVDHFESQLGAASHPAEIHWYNANHAFANLHGGDAYNEELAALADNRTLAFFEEHLAAKASA